jgi:hypothetical protein
VWYPYKKQACLLAARTRKIHVIYANALAVRASYVAARIVFLYMKIFVCFIKQARLLAIVSKLGGRGGAAGRVMIAFYG